MLTSIILAGGSSTRFGMDKNMLIIGDRILLARVADAMSFADELIISISTEEKIRKYDALIEPAHTFVVDEDKNAGAFIGLLTSAKAAKGDVIAVAPCDTPFVTANLYEVLLEQAQDHDGAAPRIGGHWEPLIAVYRREPLITLLEKNLKNNNIRLSELCSKLDVIEVDEQALEKDNIALHSFMNINKPEDLEKALVLLQ